MRGIVLALGLAPGLLMPCVALADWVRLTSDAEISAALSDRVLVYDAYTTQSFAASGQTLHITDRAALGRWEARGGQYCSAWPPGDNWSCYDLEVNGDRVRFIGADLFETEGVYAE